MKHTFVIKGPRILLSTVAISVAFSLAHAAPMFETVLPDAGIDYFGSSWGFAWSDYDGDGDPDIWLTKHTGPSTLYRNDGHSFDAVLVPPADLTRPADAHGVAWADFDNDGDPDLLEIVGADRGFGSDSNRLFVNVGSGLSEAAQVYGVDYPLGRGRYPLWFDYDADGLLDLLIMNHDRPDGQAPTALFRNTGSFFLDVSDEIGWNLGETWNATGALLSDVTGDRKLDLLFLRLKDLPSQRVYDMSTVPFDLVGNSSPFISVKDAGWAVAAVAQDFNADLIPDVFLTRREEFRDLRRLSSTSIAFNFQKTAARNEPVGMDFETNGDVTYRFSIPSSKIHVGSAGFHPRSGTFTLSISDPSTVGLAGPSSGVDAGVYVGRLDHDWMIRVVGIEGASYGTVKSSRAIGAFKPVGFAVAATPCLYPGRCAPFLLTSSPSGKYTETTVEAGLDHGQLCNFAAAGDFDNDMDMDLYQVCANPAANAPNRLFLNDGNGNFLAVIEHGAEGTQEGRGDHAAIADYNGDGFLDVYVSNGIWGFRGPDQLFRNLGNNNHWLKIDLLGTDSNVDGIGARVEATAGGKTQLREQTGGQHFGTQDDRILHFGLGPNSRVDRIRVFWPSGNVQQLFDVSGDQMLEIVEESDNEDEDSDGLPDVWEYTHSLDPFDASDRELDTDSDALTNIQEYEAGSDPNVPESDDIVQVDAPATIPPQGTVEVSIAYYIPQSRDILLSLQGAGWWGGRRIVRGVAPGYGTATIDFPIKGDPPSDKNLKWTVRILPLGLDWDQSVAHEEIGPVLREVGGGEDTIVHIDAPVRIPPQGTVEVSIDYYIPQSRDILLSLKGPGWWGGRRIARDLAPGYGTVTIDLPIKNNPPSDRDLKWTVRILPLGQDWDQSVAHEEIWSVRILP